LQATDSGGKYSQTIVEVTVIPGPNTRGPVFESPVYEVQVSEGASINSTVTTVTVSWLPPSVAYYSIYTQTHTHAHTCGHMNAYHWFHSHTHNHS
jgi:protocadherin-15